MLTDNTMLAAAHSRWRECVEVQNTFNIQGPSVSYTVTEQNEQLPKPFSDIICQPHFVLLPKEIRTEKCKNRQPYGTKERFV